ncbi:MAG: SLC13 family permease [Planctomycetota bacterium]
MRFDGASFDERSDASSFRRERLMTLQLILVLALLVAAVVMFAINKPRMDAVALIMLAVLPFTGAVTMNEALSGFSDPNIILIAALFVIGDGLVRTGVARKLGDWLTVTAGSSEIRMLLMLMLVVCGLGSMMSSTAVTAIFIPVALRIAARTGTAPSRLMMPLSFAALISGMMTLVATAPNLVVNSELVRNGSAGFNFFSFTPFGAPILGLGIVYMIFASRWLSSAQATNAGAVRRPTQQEWIDEYKLKDRAYRLLVPPHSSLIGKTLAQVDLRGAGGANIVTIERNRGSHVDLVRPMATTEILVDDRLIIDLFGHASTVDALKSRFGLEVLPISADFLNDRSQEIGLVQVILPANSALIGKTVLEAKFRSKYGLNVIGLRRGTVAQERGLLEMPLGVGDTLLLIGRWKAIRHLQQGGNDLVLLNLPAEFDEVLPVAGRAKYAVGCLALVVGLMVSGVVPNVQAALLGCLLMGALRCVTLESAYRSIDWKTIVLIVGMLPFSTALQKTGGVDLAANALMAATGEAGTYAVLASIFAITAMLGLFISNTATAVLMAPVALAIAKDSGASPYPFAMIVALAASTAFVTPVSSPVNTLVVGPGNYTFGDFVRVGAPFAVIVMIVSVILVPWLLPL